MKRSFMLSTCHHMLHKALWEDPAAYVKSLASYLEHPMIGYYEGWLPRATPYRDEAVRRIRESGKPAVYDIGPRPGLRDPDPSASDPDIIAYTLDFYRAELDLAFSIGAKKLVLDAGNDVPENRTEAKKRAGDFLCRLGASLPSDVIIVMENTDRDLQRRKLFGPTAEMVAFIEALRAEGLGFLYPMIDMGHIPLYGETPAYALDTVAPLLKHVHLSNCTLEDPSHPLYGDRHVPYGYPGGEYDVNDLTAFLKKLSAIGYLKEGNTVSFELINLDGREPSAYLSEWSTLLDTALAAAGL